MALSSPPTGGFIRQRQNAGSLAPTPRDGTPIGQIPPSRRLRSGDAAVGTLIRPQPTIQTALLLLSGLTFSFWVNLFFLG